MSDEQRVDISPATSNVVSEDWKELVERFDVRLAVVGVSYYGGDPMEMHSTDVDVPPVLKSELVKALELGANVADDEVVRLTLTLTSRRRPA